MIAHVDMDCFFCACEIKKDPSLKGKPVLVGSTSDRGVVAAASYEARKFGVFSATPISKARALCPDGIYLGVDFKYYREQSSMVMEVLSSFGDPFLQVSVDEAYIDVTEFSKKFKTLEEMAEHMKQAVFDKTQLTCSIGVAKSRVVAKIASDFNKPNGFTIVSDAKTFLEPLSITKIPGIGKKSKEDYFSQGINTIGDLALLDEYNILQKFGKYGLYYHKIALGEDRSKIESRGEMKSSSREHTFYHDTKDIHFLEKTLFDLSTEVHSDIDGKYFKTISIKVRDSNFSTITRDFSLKTPMNTLDIIQTTIIRLFWQVYDVKKRIRLLGVKVSNFLKGRERQLQLTEFIDGPSVVS